MRHSIFLLVFSLSLTLNSLLGVEPNRIKVYHLERELSHNSVTCIFQDSREFMWFGTYDGINRYDGSQIVTYKYDILNEKSLSNSRVQAIIEDTLGNLWISTNEGLNRFNRETEHFQRYYNSKDNRHSVTPGNITDVALSKTGEVWAVGEEICRYNPETDDFTRYQPREEESDWKRSGWYNRIYCDHKGRMWFSYDKDLYYYEPESDSLILFYDGYNNPIDEGDWYFLDIEQDNQNRFWITTNKAGVVIADLYKTDKLETYSGFTNISNNELLDIKLLFITKDSKGKIWITGENSGVYIFNQDGQLEDRLTSNPLLDNTLAFNSVWCVTEDKDGRFWLGEWESGVDVIDRNYTKFNHFKYLKGTNSLSHNTIRQIEEDTKGNLYIATDGGGLNYFNRKTGKFTIYKHEKNNSNSPSADAILCLELDKHGRLWMGTWNGGINIFNPVDKSFEHITPSDTGLTSPHVFDIAYNGDSIMYFSSHGGGICEYNIYNKKWTRYLSDPFDESTIISNFVYVLFIDDKNNLWGGTADNGLILLETLPGGNKRITNFVNDSKNPNSISSNTISAIFQDSEKRIWIGTQSGLNLFNAEEKNFSALREPDGLINGNVNSLAYNNGDMWIGTNRGLVKLQVADTVFRNYGLTDGIQGYQYSRGASIKLRTGELVFGGNNGFNVFHPDSVKDNPYPPKVVFTEFQIFNKPVVVGEDSPLKKYIGEADNIVLSYKHSVFSIRFSALNYTHPVENTYEYIMEGFEDNWNIVGQKTSATYTNLNPGNYTFRVRASNNDGVMNIDGNAIRIKILPPWWKTWAFRISAGLILIIVLTSAYLIRIKRLKEQQRILEDTVEERTKELKLQKEEIQQQSEELLTQRDALAEQGEELITKNEQISEAYKRSELLSEFGQKITSVLSIEAINDMMYTYVSELINISAFGIGIVDQSKGHIVFKHFIENRKSVLPFTKSINDNNSLSAYCINNQEAIHINNVEEDYNKYIQKLNTPATTQVAYSRIHIPLTVENKRIGIFVVNSFKKNAYSTDDFATLKTLASYISIALDNANAYKQINDINKSVKESINYAKSIQSAFLPTKETLNKYLDNFVLFRPKDIVSGDYYWFSPIEKDPEKPLKAFVVVADCTGHGVPGSLISMIGNNLLNEIINIKKEHNPAQVLELLNVEFQLALKQDETRNNDGMDMVVCYLEEQVENQTIKLVFSGAKNPCIIYHHNNDELEVIKGSRKSIGGVRAKRSTQFYENIEKTLKKGDSLYLITDGIIDQHSPTRERFTRAKLLNVLKRNASLDLSAQMKSLEDELDEHKKKEKQTDDITLMGIKL